MVYQYNDMANFIVNPSININWEVTWIYGYFYKFISIVVLNNIFVVVVTLLSIVFTIMLLRLLNLNTVVASLMLDSILSLSI